MAATPPSRWTVEDVARWLTACGFGTASESFRCNKVDGPTLLTLEREDLRDELGIEALAERKEIWQRICGLRTGAEPLQHLRTCADDEAELSSEAARGSAPPEDLLLSPQAPGAARQPGKAGPSPASSTRNGIARSVSSLSAQSDGSSPSVCLTALQMLPTTPTNYPPSDHATSLGWSDFSWTYRTGTTSPTSSASASTASELTFRSHGARAGGERIRLRQCPDMSMPEAESKRLARGLRKALVAHCGESTASAFASLLAASQRLTERVLSRLLVGLGPAGVGRDGDLRSAAPGATLPAAAVTLLRAYNVTTDVGDVTLAAAAEALRQPSASLEKFVRDTLRVCEGVSVPKGGSISDRDWMTVVQVLGLGEVIEGAVAELQAATKHKERKHKRQRLHLAPPALSEEQAAEVHHAAMILKRMCAPVPSIPALAAVVRRTSDMLETILMTLVRALAPRADPPEAGAPLPPVGISLLRSCGVAVDEQAAVLASAPLTLSVAADVMRKSRAVDKLLGHALRVCEGIDPSPRGLEPLFDDELEAFVSIFGLSARLVQLASRPVHADPQPQRPRPARQPAALSTAELAEVLKIGDEVAVLADVDEVKRLTSEIPRLGWQDEMAPYCGTLGTVKRFDVRDRKAGKVQIKHADLVPWTWPLAAVRPVGSTHRPAEQEEPQGVVHRLCCPPGVTWQVHSKPSGSAPVTHAGVTSGSEVIVTDRLGGWLRIAGGGWVRESADGGSGWRRLGQRVRKGAAPAAAADVEHPVEQTRGQAEIVADQRCPEV